jgi:hypothetical protein
VFGIAGCEVKPEAGYLNVSAPGDGIYEIYRIASESPLQFVSEQSGEFNKDIALAPGNYLVLADCSSETVIILPGQQQRLVAHKISFLPPRQPDPQDSFSIQCSRSEKTRSRQHLTNRYELFLIHGQQDLLVGMVPMHVDFTKLAQPGETKELSYKLSALQVASVDGRYQEVSYFVSPVNELTAVTTYQKFGRWEYLLPGRYMVEVNGTRTEVELAEGDERVIQPALLRVSTTEGLELEQAARVTGSPWLVEINGGHWLSFNETYPTLPGKAYIKVSGSTDDHEITLVEGEMQELKARSVTVDTGCGAFDWECLGNKDVSLYLAEETYPFVESVSDIPIVFIDRGKGVLVGIAGSRDILYELPVAARDKTLELGYVALTPEPQHKAGQMTDLVRVQSIGTPFSGHTLDVNLEKPTLMPLVSGMFHLDHFLTNTSVEGDRRQQSRAFVIEPGRTTDVTFPVFFSEKRLATYKKRVEQEAEEAKNRSSGASGPIGGARFL